MLERKYFSRKEVANYFWINVQTLIKIMEVNKIESLSIPTYIADTWKVRSKIYRISKEQILEIESKFKKIWVN